MTLFRAGERGFAAAVSQLVYANPFLPERIAGEREALGDEFSDEGAVWSTDPQRDVKGAPTGVDRRNVVRIQEKVEALVAELRAACAKRHATRDG